MRQSPPPHKGRGTDMNPGSRYERFHVEPLEDADDTFAEPPDERKRVETRFYIDSSKSAITSNDSPDVPFSFSINAYRGCEHGCIYCYARPYHEYLGFSAGLDFETRIMIKPEIDKLLVRQLSSRSWKPAVIALSGVTDPYQPAERRLELTRKCLAVLLRFRNPVMVITKNALVVRDLDILAEMASMKLASVGMSVTTLRPELARVLEPRTSAPYKRLEAVRQLRAAGVPAGVMMSPLIPGLNDEELPAIIKAAAEHDAQWFGHLVVRLPHGVKDLFAGWLQEHYPDRVEKVLGRIRAMRGGRLNSPEFYRRMTGTGEINNAVRKLARLAKEKYGLTGKLPEMTTALFRRADESQGTLF